MNSLFLPVFKLTLLLKNRNKTKFINPILNFAIPKFTIPKVKTYSRFSKKNKISPGIITKTRRQQEQWEQKQYLGENEKLKNYFSEVDIENLKIHEVNVRALSSWVATLKFVPFNSQVGALWFWTKKSQKGYVIPNVAFDSFTELIDPGINSPGRGVGTTFWRRGYLSGATGRGSRAAAFQTKRIASFKKRYFTGKNKAKNTQMLKIRLGFYK